jgi:hypothetical protein
MPQGSLPGERRGGRQKGTPNRTTIERRIRTQAGIIAANVTGVTPLDLILMVARGGEAADKITDRQLNAAIAAAPYVHPRLAAVAVKDLTMPDPILLQQQAEVRAALIARLQALAIPEPLQLPEPPHRQSS